MIILNLGDQNPLNFFEIESDITNLYRFKAKLYPKLHINLKFFAFTHCATLPYV